MKGEARAGGASKKVVSSNKAARKKQRFSSSPRKSVTGSSPSGSSLPSEAGSELRGSLKNMEKAAKAALAHWGPFS